MIDAERDPVTVDVAHEGRRCGEEGGGLGLRRVTGWVGACRSRAR